MTMAVPIPGITNSADQSVDAPHYSSIYLARSSGYLVGSFIGGLLFDRFNRLFLLFISLLLTSLFVTVTPWCKILWLLRATMVTLGILMGFLDTGCNVLCLDLWGRNSGPFMQALHFSFGLGIFIAPMLPAPFIEVVQINSSSEVNSSFPQKFHISDPHAEKLIKKMFDSSDFKNESVRVDRDVTHQNVYFFSNDTDVGEAWSDSSNRTTFSTTSSSVETLKDSSAVVKIHTKQLSMGLHSENKTLLKNVEFTASGVELPSELANSTEAPNTHTTSRVPKPKPSFTDAGKLDHTKDWDKVPVGKPPPEDLVAPSTVKSVVISSTSTTPAQVTQTPASVNVSLVTTSVNIIRASNETEHEISNVTVHEPQILEKLQSEVKNLGNKSLNGKEVKPDAFNGAKKEIAQKGSEENQLFHKSADASLKDKNESINSSIETQKISKEPDSSALKENNQHLNGSEGVFSSSNRLSPTISPTSVTPTSDPGTQIDRSLLKEKSSIEHEKKNSSENGGLKPVDHMVNSQLKSTYKTVNISTEKENDIVRNSEFYGDNVEHSTEKVISTTTVSSHPINVVHITVHELDKLIQGEEYKFNGDHENSSISTVEDGYQNQHSFSLTFTSEMPVKHEHHFKPGTYDNDTEEISTIFDVFANRIEKYGFNKIQFTYLIVGLFVFSVSLVFLGFLCHNPRDPKSKQEDGIGQHKISSKFLWCSLVSCMSLFFCFSIGIEVTFGRYLILFAVRSDLNLSRATGNSLVALFWGSFAAMRFASIFCASGFSPTSMLIFNFLMCSLGSIILSTLSNEMETALWLGTSLLGIGLASMFPTGVLWIERYIHVTNKVAAFFVMGVSLGEIICPMVVQYLMQSNLLMLMHASVASIALCIFIFMILWCLVSHHGEKYASVGNNGYQLANQHDEEEDMVELSPSTSSVGLRIHGSPNELGLLLNGHSSYGH
ncbi:hypothetical protein J437_LFUL016772 [Ladona fulva]|uniref:Sodium-dependent glucose transporter 1 n=1 Tax=Ladona fulva TaxID=123851 RepID=A0A8K0KK43_LADFU|nr:hypothetical protein J437_LFUL016772 [Ladona fulva]